MNLLLFLQTGLLFSANRWKVVVSKSKPLLWLCGIFYVIAPLLEKPNSMWAAPLFFYLFILMADLMSADAGGVFANSGERFRCIVFATGFTKKGGERRLSEGVFIKAKGLHIVDMFPVTDCRERLLDERTLIIKPKDFSSCCLYSAAYPKGLILGEAVDDALVFFYSKKAKMLRVAEPGLLGKVSGIAGVAAGRHTLSLMAERVLTRPSTTVFATRIALMKHDFSAPNKTTVHVWCLRLYFPMVKRLRRFGLKMCRKSFLQTKTAVGKGCITMRKNMRMPWRENRKNIKNGSIVLPFFC